MPLVGASIVTSLPDVSELRALDLAAWQDWFVTAAEKCALATDPHGIAVFYQTDAKINGRWVDKSALVHRGVARTALVPVFHWIVLRGGDLKRGGSRAQYSHLLGFSQHALLNLALGLPDVIADAGPTTWTRGMGLYACETACNAVQKLTPTRTIVDPFCGHGSVLAVANAMGLDAVGVELGQRRAQRARNLTHSALALGEPRREKLSASDPATSP